jgi:hypothetical protein
MEIEKERRSTFIETRAAKNKVRIGRRREKAFVRESY